jgi:hypothetical protein
LIRRAWSARSRIVQRDAGRHGGGHRARSDRPDRDAHGAPAGGGPGDRGRARRTVGGGRPGRRRYNGELRARDPVQAVRDATNGRGVDEAVECSGAAGTFRQAVQMVCKGGRVVLLGVPPDHVVGAPAVQIRRAQRDRDLRLARQSECLAQGDQPDRRGQLQVGDLVTHSFPLENFATRSRPSSSAATARSRSWSSRTDAVLRSM